MQPKKRSRLVYLIYVFFLFLLLYLAVHSAIVYESVLQKLAEGEIASQQQVPTFIVSLVERLETTPFVFEYNRHTLKSLGWSAFAWLLGVAMWVLSRKNYIHGMEHGTSRWGTKADIKDLFADNIKAKEIKKAKKMRTWFGRRRVKRKAYKMCEKNGKILLETRLKQLKEEEQARKRAKQSDKKLYKENQQNIRQEVAEEVAKAKIQAWEPDRRKEAYLSELKKINETEMLSEAEKEIRRNKEKAEYDKDVNAFYNFDKRVAKIEEKYKDADMLFTKTERISFYNYILNNNTLILGGSGSGKTRSYVMPNILQAHSSYVITDPKGEILEKSGYFLSQIKGYKVRVLNLKEKAESDGYNPFVYVHPEREGYEERVMSLIETILINTVSEEKKSSSDPFWDNAERLFLQSIFFFTCDGFIPEERNMNTVMSLIRMLKIEEENDDMDSKLDVFAEVFADRFGEDHLGVQQFKEFREKASGKTAKSVVISSVARLAPFKTKAVQNIFAYDSVQLDKVGTEKTAIFVVVPPTDNTFNFIAGMLFTQLFQELEYCATVENKHRGQRLPVPCRFILDEYANTCKIPKFTKILAYARSFGIGITPILQSLEQIKSMHEKEWGVVIDNCNTLLYLGSITHMDTLEYISKLLGKATFDKQTTGQTSGTNGSSSKNEDVIGRELMDSAEIRKLPKKNCLLIVGGRNPFYSEKYDYTSHPNYRFTSDANPEYSFHYKPVAPPKKDEQNGDKESPHREEQETNLAPSENAYVEIDPIKIDTSPVNQLTHTTKLASSDSLTIISDDELEVIDGENDAEESGKRFMRMLDEEEAGKKAAKLTVSEATRQLIEETKADKIRVEENLIMTVNRLGRLFRNYEPIPDEELVVDEGDGDGELNQQELDDIFDDDVDNEIDEVLDDVMADAASLSDTFFSTMSSPNNNEGKSAEQQQ